MEEVLPLPLEGPAEKLYRKLTSCASPVLVLPKEESMKLWLYPMSSPPPREIPSKAIIDS